MKRFLMLVGVAVVAAAMYVAASPASRQAKGPTAKQFNALKKQVASLSKTVKTLKAVTAIDTGVLAACDQLAVPIDQFGNPQPTDTSTPEGYEYGKGPTFPGTQEFFTTGLDVTDPTLDTGALFITGGDSTCASLINPSALRHGAAKVGVMLPHASMHAPAFTAHQR
jgi:hypothetical protein